GGVAKAAHCNVGPLHWGTPGFAPAINFGLKYAKGDHIVLLNDDTIPQKGWLDQLLGALARARTDYPEIRWGYAGPMSNQAMGAQNLDPEQFPQANQPEMAAAHAATLASLEHVYVPIGVASGFCLLLTREFYEAVGQLEVFGLGGFEDNDLCLRGHEKGFLGLVALKSFVYHFGSITLRRFAPDHRKGTEHAREFMAKWYRPRQKTLCIAYRVKIDTLEAETYFLKSLAKAKEVADAVVIVDDRSARDLPALFRAHNLESLIVHYHRNTPEMGFDEIRDRNRALEMARETKCDWIWNLISGVFLW